MQPYGRAKEIERNENGEDTRRKKMKNCLVLLEFWQFNRKHSELILPLPNAFAFVCQTEETSPERGKRERFNEAEKFQVNFRANNWKKRKVGDGMTPIPSRRRVHNEYTNSLKNIGKMGKMKRNLSKTERKKERKRRWIRSKREQTGRSKKTTLNWRSTEAGNSDREEGRKRGREKDRQASKRMKGRHRERQQQTN
ncbi:hypothetical protein RUM43_008293 [Polyplax serrata]|uniref:Uncharacterized protein n=1 Tax=Polyplax serrata TaxID=468196 RepID=A0AAN8PEJ9_POLSC